MEASSLQELVTLWEVTPTGGKGVLLWMSLLTAAQALIEWTPTKKTDSFWSVVGGGAQMLKNVLLLRAPSDFIREQDPKAARERVSD